MKKIILFSIFILQVLLFSCDKPRCENTNPIYLNNTIDSKVYNDELLKELSTEENLSFWLKDVIMINNKEYLIVNIYNENVCVDAQFLVRDWEHINGITKKNYSRHKGAQLKGFQYSITYTSADTILNVKGLSSIVD